MFNDSKKNSFLTEAKTVYSEVSKKYISESMKGNKLTYVSSEDDTKLDMTGKKLQYCVLLNADGSVKSMKVSNGEWIVELPSGKKITDLKNTDLKDGNLDNEECGPKKPKTFADDDWDTIASVAKSCVNNEENCPYKVGNTKTVKVNGKEFTVRLANLKAPNECNNSGFSQSACGFVVEFADVITTHNMNDTATNKGGWPASAMYKFLNDESDSSSIINLLPKELKNVIKPTITVSGRGSEDTVEYFTSPEDKLYLLAPKEIYSDWSNQYDSARDYTRQLDYYEGVTINSCAKAIKNNSAGSASWWWLRCANSNSYYAFYSAYDCSYWNYFNAITPNGVSPAFRIG